MGIVRHGTKNYPEVIVWLATFCYRYQLFHFRSDRFVVEVSGFSGADRVAW